MGRRKTVAEKKVLLRQVKNKVFHTKEYVFDPEGIGWHWIFSRWATVYDLSFRKISWEFPLWHGGLRIWLQWLRLLWRCRFDPWPGNFHILWVQPFKKKKGRKGGRKEGGRKEREGRNSRISWLEWRMNEQTRTDRPDQMFQWPRLEHWKKERKEMIPELLQQGLAGG